MGNPRYANGNLRRKNRARLKAMGCECGICHGRLGPIHYDEPSDYEHPLSFVVDEKIPVSKWKEYGYTSARAVAEDLTRKGTHLEMLKSLALLLAKELEEPTEKTNIAMVAKQYRETLNEIDELEGANKSDEDELGELLQRRSDNGKPGAVRKNRSGVSRNRWS